MSKTYTELHKECDEKIANLMYVALTEGKTDIKKLANTIKNGHENRKNRVKT